MYLHRSIIDPEPDDKLRRHHLRPVTISVDTSHFPTSALSHSNASFMRFQKRIQTASLTSWQIALIVIGALIFIAIIYALYIIYQLRRSKQTGQYSTGTSFFGLLSTRRPAGRRRGSSTSRRRDGRSKRRRGSAHLSSADSGVAGVAIGGRDDDDKEMDSPVKMSRLLNGTPSQPAHRSPVGASPSTIAMMHYHHNDGEEEEISLPPPPTGSTLRPSTGFTSSSSITHTSFPAPYAKDGASLHEAASIKEYASIKERAPESTSPSVGSPIISSPLHSLLGDPLSTSAKSTGGFSLGNTLSAALDKHRQRRGSKSSTNTTPTPSLLQTGSALASSPPHSGSIISGRPRSQTQSHSQTKSPRPRSRASRSQTRTLDDGQHHGSPPTSAGGPSSPLSPSSLGASLGLFGRHHSSSTHSHSAQTTSQQSKSHHGPRHQLSKEDGLRGRETEREREFDFDDRDSIAHTIRESFGDDNDYSRIEGEMETEMDEQVSTSFTTQSGTGSASGTSNAHTYSGEVTPRGASVPRISSPRASTKRLGSSHSTASHGYGAHSFTPPTTAMSRTTFAENGVAVPFSGIGLAFGRAGRDTSDTERESKRPDKDKERSRRRRGERNEEYG